MIANLETSLNNNNDDQSGGKIVPPMEEFDIHGL